METMTKSYSTEASDLRDYVSDLLNEIHGKLNDFAVIDILDKKVVVYYTWTWYKKRLKKELGKPFIIRKIDMYNKKGEISNSKWDELSRKLVNYFIWQKENGNTLIN